MRLGNLSQKFYAPRMNETAGRGKRIFAALLFIPILLLCTLFCFVLLLIAVKDFHPSALWDCVGLALVSIAFGGVGYALQRRMQKTWRGEVPAWSWGTWLAVFGDLLVVLVILIAIPKINDLQRVKAEAEARVSSR